MRCLCFFLALFVFNISVALAEEGAWKIIELAYQASQNENYKGIFITQQGQELKSVEIAHALHGREKFTRVTMLDGNDDEILSHGENVVIYHKRDKNIVMQKREPQHLFPAIFPKDISVIKDHYLLSFGRPDRVAGRMTQSVMLTPNDDFRYTYHFWLDEQTSLQLKMAVLNLEKEVLEQSFFSKIQFIPAIDLDWFKPNIDPSKEYVMDEGGEKEKNLNRFWKAGNVPPGFKETNFMVSKMPNINTMSYHTVYSDGLSYISLFLQPIAKDKKPKVGDITINATHVAARYYKGYQIMAVGTVPLKAVKNLIDSVEF